MSSASFVSGGGFANLNPFAQSIKEGFQHMGSSISHVAKETVKTAGSVGKTVLTGINTATNGVEPRSYTHLFFSGVIESIRAAKGVLPGPLETVATTIDIAEGFFCAWDFLEIGKYFFHKEGSQVHHPKISKNPVTGELERVEKCQGETKARFHTTHGKVLKVISKVGSAVKGFAACVALMHRFSVINLAHCASVIGKIPVIGHAISQIITPVFFQSLACVGGIVAYGALTIDSIIYISKAIKDPDKSLVKGFLNLASRVSLLALSATVLAGVATPHVIVPLMVVGGATGLAAIFYSIYRDAQKAKIQKAHLQELVQTGGV